MEATYWLVTVQKVGHRKQTRRIAASSAHDAGRMARELIGGPKAYIYDVVKCIPGEMVGAPASTGTSLTSNKEE